MFKIYYDVLKPIYNEKVNLIYTDTDSLCIQVYTNDIYARVDMCAWKYLRNLKGIIT